MSRDGTLSRSTKLPHSIERGNYSIGHLLLLVVTAELVLFGGGRLINIGPISIRMMLFALAQIYVMCKISKTHVSMFIIFLVFTLTWSLALSAVIGLLNNANIDMVLSDIKTIIYFIMLFFFSVTIKDKRTIMSLSNIIKICSILLMAMYIGILIAIYLNYIDYQILYDRLINSDEIMISDGRIFYKGFLYLCIGFIFFVVEKTKFAKILSILFFISIVMTFTRGFLLSTLFVYLVYLTIFTPLTVKKIFFILLAVILISLFFAWYLNNVGDRSDISNLPRIITMNQVKNTLTVPSLLFGHGLGIGVNERPEHMEMTYLEIFHKQGILGLSIWMVIFIIIVKKYHKIKNINNKFIAMPYVLATILIYIQTATNPYLNNPIGMGLVLMTLIIVFVLNDEKWDLSPDYSLPKGKMHNV